MTVRFSDLLAVMARPLLFGLYFLSGFVPRNNRRWVFGSWSGWRFEDNTGAFFEFLHSRPNTVGATIEAIWITRDPQIVERLTAQGYRACLPWSPAGLWACLTAGIYIFDGLTKDINHWTSRGAYRVLLHHGGGIKKIERAIETPQHHLYRMFHGNIGQRILWTVLVPWHRVVPDYAIANSPGQIRQAELCYNMRADQQSITGFPRNDCLFAPPANANGDTDIQWMRAQRAEGYPVFLYLPTFRDDSSRFERPMDMLDELCSKLGLRVLIRPHFVDEQRQGSRRQNPWRNIHIGRSDGYLNRLFPESDGLISDYSSVTYDYILTGKPVVFYVPDLDDYLTYSRTLFYDFHEVSPGPKARTPEELEQALRAAVESGVGDWQELYQRVLDEFHTIRRPGASERVYQEICRRFVPSATTGKSDAPLVTDS